MTLEKTAQKAVRKIEEALAEHNLDENTRRRIMKIVRKSLIKTVEETSETHREATVICCGPEADLAHKIQEEAERKIGALIANLQAMR